MSTEQPSNNEIILNPELQSTTKELMQRAAQLAGEPIDSIDTAETWALADFESADYCGRVRIQAFYDDEIAFSPALEVVVVTQTQETELAGSYFLKLRREARMAINQIHTDGTVVRKMTAETTIDLSCLTLEDAQQIRERGWQPTDHQVPLTEAEFAPLLEAEIAAITTDELPDLARKEMLEETRRLLPEVEAARITKASEPKESSSKWIQMNSFLKENETASNYLPFSDQDTSRLQTLLEHLPSAEEREIQAASEAFRNRRVHRGQMPIGMDLINQLGGPDNLSRINIWEILSQVVAEEARSTAFNLIGEYRRLQQETEKPAFLSQIVESINTDLFPTPANARPLDLIDWSGATDGDTSNLIEHNAPDGMLDPASATALKLMQANGLYKLCKWRNATALGHTLGAIEQLAANLPGLDLPSIELDKTLATLITLGVGLSLDHKTKPNYQYAKPERLSYMNSVESMLSTTDRIQARLKRHSQTRQQS